MMTTNMSIGDICGAGFKKAAHDFNYTTYGSMAGIPSAVLAIAAGVFLIISSRERLMISEGFPLLSERKVIVHKSKLAAGIMLVIAGLAFGSLSGYGAFYNTHKSLNRKGTDFCTQLEFTTKCSASPF